MAEHTWYRNEDWNAVIEAAFRTKLARARPQKRPQYLKLQAGHLASQHPEAALALIDEYLETGDQFFVSQAHTIRAKVLESLARIDEAVAAYRAALDWECNDPGITGTARLDYPRTVAEYRIQKEFDHALAVLDQRFDDEFVFVFPAARYLWNGSKALILHEQGRGNEAMQFAQAAIAAATERKTAVSHNQTVGLVDKTSDEFGRRLRAIAGGSVVRQLYGLFKK